MLVLKLFYMTFADILICLGSCLLWAFVGRQSMTTIADSKEIFIVHLLADLYDVVIFLHIVSTHAL